MKPINQQPLACGSTYPSEEALGVAVEAWQDELQTQLVKSRHKVHYSRILRWNCAGGDTCSLTDCRLELEASEGLNGGWNIISFVDRHMSAETYEAWCEREYRVLAGYDEGQADVQQTSLSHLPNSTASSSHLHDADFTFPRKYSNMSASTAMTISISADTCVSSTTDTSTSASIFSERPREQSSDTGCPTSPETLSRIIRLSPASPVPDDQSARVSHTRGAIGGDTPTRVEAGLFQSGLDASPGSRDILSVLASQAVHRAEETPSQKASTNAQNNSLSIAVNDSDKPELEGEELPEVLLSSHEAPGSSCSTLTDLDSEMEALIVFDTAPSQSTSEKSKSRRNKTSDQRLASPTRRSSRRKTEAEQQKHASPLVAEKTNDAMSTRALRKRRQNSPERDSKKLRSSTVSKTPKVAQVASRIAADTQSSKGRAPKAAKSKGPRRLVYPPVKIDMDFYDRFSSRLMGTGSDSEEEDSLEDGMRTQYKAEGFTRDAYTAGLYTKVEWDDDGQADGDDELEEEVEDDLDSALMDIQGKDEKASATSSDASEDMEVAEQPIEVEDQHSYADGPDRDRTHSAATAERSAHAEADISDSPRRSSAEPTCRSRSASSLVIEYVDEPIGAEDDPFSMQDRLTSVSLNVEDPPDGSQLPDNHHGADLHESQDQDLGNDLAGRGNADKSEELLGQRDENERCVKQEEVEDDDDGIPDSLLDTLPGARTPDRGPSPLSINNSSKHMPVSYQPPVAQTPQANTSGAIPPVLAFLYK